MQHPYADLPKSAFWRSAVTETDPGAMHGIYQPKFPLRLSDRVATAGSCFAQHLGRAAPPNTLNTTNKKRAASACYARHSKPKDFET